MDKSLLLYSYVHLMIEFIVMLLTLLKKTPYRFSNTINLFYNVKKNG